jgi:hypothetical protein
MSSARFGTDRCPSKQSVKRLRREIGPIRPNDRSTHRIEDDPSEVTGIVEGLEYRAAQEWFNVNDRLRAVAEGQFQMMRATNSAPTIRKIIGRSP